MPFTSEPLGVGASSLFDLTNVAGSSPLALSVVGEVTGGFVAGVRAQFYSYASFLVNPNASIGPLDLDPNVEIEPTMGFSRGAGERIRPDFNDNPPTEGNQFRLSGSGSFGYIDTSVAGQWLFLATITTEPIPGATQPANEEFLLGVQQGNSTTTLNLARRYQSSGRLAGRCHLMGGRLLNIAEPDTVSLVIQHNSPLSTPSARAVNLSIRATRITI